MQLATKPITTATKLNAVTQIVS